MKLVAKLTGVLLVLVIVVGVGAVFYVNTIVKKGIETGGETALGVPTRVEGVNLSVLGGEATMSNLSIANPAGFSTQPFLQLGFADMAVSLNSLLSDKIMIPRVELRGIRVNLEQRGGKNNVNPLLERARRLAGESKGGSASQQPVEEGKKFIISYFSLDDVQVKANLDVLGQNSSLTLVLPKIELRNLGAEEQGLPLPELIEKIVQVILATAQQSSGQLSPALARLLSGELGDLQSLQADVIGKARGRVDTVVGDLEEKLQISIPEEDKKAIEEKAGELLKGLGGRLGGN